MTANRRNPANRRPSPPANADQRGKLEKIGALWAGTSTGGTKYLSGVIDGVRVVVFRNGFKKEDKHPDYVVYLSAERQETTPSDAAKPDDEIPL